MYVCMRALNMQNVNMYMCICINIYIYTCEYMFTNMYR